MILYHRGGSKHIINIIAALNKKTRTEIMKKIALTLSSYIRHTKVIILYTELLLTYFNVWTIENFIFVHYLQGMLEVIKPDGVILFNLRATQTENEYTTKFHRMIKDLEERQIIKEIAKQQFHHFKTDDIKDMYSNIYVCRKCQA